MQNPVVSREGGFRGNSCCIWHSQADRPDEGATDAERWCHKQQLQEVSFLKHMSEDLI